MGVEEEPTPVLYIPFRQFTLPFMSVVVRGEGGAAAAGDSGARSAEAGSTRILRSTISCRCVPCCGNRSPRLGSGRCWSAVFAMSAVALAAVGLYGLISYSVAQRTREIGIRVALGARPGQVMSPVIREGMTLALIGIGLGLAARWRRRSCCRLTCRRRSYRSADVRGGRRPVAAGRAGGKLHSLASRPAHRPPHRPPRRVRGQTPV